METKIKKTIAEWLPEAIKEIGTEKVSDYEILHVVSDYCINILKSPDSKEKAVEVFKVINMLYQEEHVYAKHCIENEFICNFIENSSALRLKEYLNDMPSPLKEAFIKTLIEI
ncbi:hypothetical protein GWA97_08300 [Flavobacterium sp. LaA7.5]|nr:hypothetical protein [Flavobacterium salilacus subsp. altitudinum]